LFRFRALYCPSPLDDESTVRNLNKQKSNQQRKTQHTEDTDLFPGFETPLAVDFPTFVTPFDVTPTEANLAGSNDSEDTR